MINTSYYHLPPPLNLNSVYFFCERPLPHTASFTILYAVHTTLLVFSDLDFSQVASLTSHKDLVCPHSCNPSFLLAFNFYNIAIIAVKKIVK